MNTTPPLIVRFLMTVERYTEKGSAYPYIVRVAEYDPLHWPSARAMRAAFVRSCRRSLPAEYAEATRKITSHEVNRI